MHDPTTLNRQGNDSGSQYRSAIFYHSDQQKLIAEKVTSQAQVHYDGLIKTTLEKYNVFVTAEQYHQDYLTNNPHGYECIIFTLILGATHFERSWEQIKSQFRK